MRSCLAIGLLAAALAGPATAQLIQTVQPAPRNHPAIGQQYREVVLKGAALAQGEQPQQAVEALAPVRSYCDAQQQRALRFVSVATQAQYDRYLSAHGEGAPLEWLDMACTHAYYYTGYALVAQRRFAEALPYLEQAIALAPYFPDAPNEKGAALNQLGRLDEAIASYRSVLAIGEEDPVANYDAPLAWRGIGYALIEKQDWAGAKAAYDKSLELAPGNALALNELEYIRQHAGAQTPGP